MIQCLVEVFPLYSIALVHFTFADKSFAQLS